MLMTSSRIDTEDPGAVPGASTIDTLVVRCNSPPIIKRVRQKRLVYNCSHWVKRCLTVYLCWGRNRIDWCNKNKIETEANVLDANDNAPIAYRLAA